MSDIQTIQEELIAIYEAISLPVLGAPTGYKHEPENGFNTADLPAVVVNRGIQLSSTPIASNRKVITREYITDLYCYTFNDSDPVNATSRNNTADCIPSVLGAFVRLHALDTSGVFAHQINADTGDVELYARDNQINYIGVRFRHEVTYYEWS